MKRIGILSVLTAAALVIAGCGSSASTDEPAGQAGSSIESSQASDAETAGDEAGSGDATEDADDADSSDSDTEQNDGGAASGPLKRVDVMLPFTMQGFDAPMAQAITEGWYEAEGLDVRLVPGQGSQVTASTVAQGNADIGLADAGTIAVLMAKGADLKVVSSIVQKTSIAINTHGMDVTSIDDIVGMPLVHGTADASTLLFQVVLKKHGYSMSDFDEIVVGSGAFVPTFLQNPDAIMIGQMISTFHNIKQQQPEAKAFSLADFGLVALNQSFVVSDETLDKDPEMVRSFLKVTMKAFEAALEDPDAAIDAAEELFPTEVGPNRDAHMGQLQAALELRSTERTADKPFGWIHEDDWTETIETLIDGGLIEDGDRTDLSGFYTNEYLP